ncbi:hypothetical protein ACFO8Q_20570 [Effusibacillus consociatus]|uniref:Uncharacterized protein n=1 Tax=Effusibacillus consociatus TaxID=1117041 RepID=A0ABV9Q6P5_9BACL
MSQYIFSVSFLEQLSMITNGVLDKQVLDEWLEHSKDKSDISVE